MEAYSPFRSHDDDDQIRQNVHIREAGKCLTFVTTSTNSHLSKELIISPPVESLLQHYTKSDSKLQKCVKAKEVSLSTHSRLL